jgi:hypothetical protein
MRGAIGGAPRDKNEEVNYQRVSELLTRVLYIGYFEALQWGIPRCSWANYQL